MLEALCVGWITVASAATISNSLDKKKHIDSQKNILINNIVKFSDLPKYGDNDDFIVSIENKQPAGILTIFASEKYCGKQTFGNLNMGIDRFYPPVDVNNILCNTKTTITTNSHSVFLDVLGKLCAKNVDLPKSLIWTNMTKFSANYYNFENKTIYAYGRKVGTNFVADIMGTCQNQIVNKIYAEAYDNAETEISVGTIGVAFGIMCFLHGGIFR